MNLDIRPGKPTLIPAKQAARQLGVHATKVNQYGRDNLLVIIRGEEGSFVPAEMLVQLDELPAPDLDSDEKLAPATHGPLPHLRGTITLLRDADFSDREILAWLWETNAELGATPIELIHGGMYHAVNRVAATLGF